ncbi:MAG: TetR/AcrR family transcriptional regulator [Nocardioidaceae bacterium]
MSETEERVARYGQEHKQATRQRIIEAAGRRFKKDGIDGSGIATLMADAGLTNGAFYAHFISKQDLVATVIADQLRAQADGYDTLAPGRAGLEDFIREYLSPQHRNDRESGCPSAALLDEIGRCAAETKASFTTGAQTIIDQIAGRLAADEPESQRGTAVALFTMLVGTMQLSRALDDQHLADEVLELGIQNALDLLHRS